MKKALFLAIALIIIGATLNGYSLTGASPVKPGVVASTITAKLENKIKQKPNVLCSQTLPAKVGASIRCVASLPSDGIPYGVTVTVYSISNNVVSYNFVVDGIPETTK